MNNVPKKSSHEETQSRHSLELWDYYALVKAERKLILLMIMDARNNQ